MDESTEIIAPQPDRQAQAPSDVLRLVVAVTTLLVVVGIGWLFNEAVVGFVADLLVGLSALPEWLISGLVVGGQLVSLVLVVGGLVLSVVRREWMLIGGGFLAVGVGLLLLSLIEPAIDENAAVVVDFDSSYALVAPDDVVSAGALCALVALVTWAGPWVSRRWRRLAWGAVVALAVEDGDDAAHLVRLMNELEFLAVERMKGIVEANLRYISIVLRSDSTFPIRAPD